MNWPRNLPTASACSTTAFQVALAQSRILLRLTASGETISPPGSAAVTRTKACHRCRPRTLFRYPSDKIHDGVLNRAVIP